MNTNILKEAGLQDSEISVYLSLLRQNEATATKITSITGIHRSYVYDIIEKLREKGLVSFVIKNNIKYFKAASPRRILDYIKEKEEKLKNLLPELLKINKEKEGDTQIEIYKGKEGIKTILNDLINEGQDYFLFGELNFEKILPIYVKQFVKQVNKKNIIEKAILPEGTKIIPTKKKEYRSISNKYLFPNAVLIYGKNVGIFIWDTPPQILLIKNKSLVKSYKTHFNILWDISKPI